MNRRPPQNMSTIGKVRASPPAPASQHAHMKASQLVTNFHMIPPTTTPRPARNPNSCGGAGSSRSSLLKPRLCSHPKSGLHPNRPANRHRMPFLLYLPAFFHGHVGWKCPARAEEESPCKLKSRWPNGVCQYNTIGVSLGPHPFNCSQQEDRFQQKPDSSSDPPLSEDDFGCGPHR